MKRHTLSFCSQDYESDEQASKILCLDLWDEYSWNDPRLSWNTDKCDVADLNMPLDKVWVPDLQIDKG